MAYPPSTRPAPPQNVTTPRPPPTSHRTPDPEECCDYCHEPIAYGDPTVILTMGVKIVGPGGAPTVADSVEYRGKAVVHVEDCLESFSAELAGGEGMGKNVCHACGDVLSDTCTECEETLQEGMDPH
jgi:hypothetical protein